LLNLALEKVNPNGFRDGENLIYLTKMLSNFPGMEKYLTSDYNNFVKNELSQEKINIQNILYYPSVPNKLWTDIPAPYGLIDGLHFYLFKIKFKIKLDNNKIVARSRYLIGEKIINSIKTHSPPTEPCDSATRWSEYYQFKNSKQTKSFEEFDILLVDSVNVDQIGIDKVKPFVKLFNQTFCVGPICLQTTSHNDMYSLNTYYGLKVHEQYLNDFLVALNKQFGTNIVDDFRIIFAFEPKINTIKVIQSFWVVNLYKSI